MCLNHFEVTLEKDPLWFRCNGEQKEKFKKDLQSILAQYRRVFLSIHHNSGYEHTEQALFADGGVSQRVAGVRLTAGEPAAGTRSQPQGLEQSGPERLAQEKVDEGIQERV